MPCPQRAEGPWRLRSERLDRGAQRRIGIQDARREPLEEVRLVGGDAEVAQLDLRLRPGEARDAVERGRIPVLVGERERALARVGDDRRQLDARRRPGGQAHAAAQAEDRIEHRADRVRERPPLLDRDRDPGSSGPRPRKRAAVRLVLQRADSSPCTVITCAAQTGSSRSRGPAAGEQRLDAPGRTRSGRRGSRTRDAPRRRRRGARTISAYDVTSISRGRVPRLVSETCRISASSSVETTIRRLVAIGPSRRWISTRSSE